MRVVFLGATKGMGRALARLMAARGDRLFLLGRERVERYFDVRRMVREYERLYLGLEPAVDPAGDPESSFSADETDSRQVTGGASIDSVCGVIVE